MLRVWILAAASVAMGDNVEASAGSTVSQSHMIVGRLTHATATIVVKGTRHSIEGGFLALIGSAEAYDVGGQPESNIMWLSQGPNPAPGAVRITFNLPSTGHARLGIYDVRGCLVRELVQEQLVAGEHDITWDGTDESGRPVGSGVYFTRLDGERSRIVGKLVMLR